MVSLGKQVEKIVTRIANVETLALQSIDYARRLERQVDNVGRRIYEQKDDLELMLKAELMGRLTPFETTVELLLDDKIGAIDTRIEKLGMALPDLIANAVRQVLTERNP